MLVLVHIDTKSAELPLASESTEIVSDNTRLEIVGWVLGRLGEIIMGDFRVRSFEAFDTINQDRDVGPVRVAGAHLQTLGGRNALIHFFKMENGRPVKSHVRIVRAKTTEPDLRMDEIALQYDDRLALGINGARERQELSINKAWQ